ncbi:MAG: isocitrate lyase/phosphoenolpyruvate mutase family protein, partial [Proteobacteria bacterium]|nr:isocitrate lyase/phosphoenolpyruvate mutase family protein [Pseudomonadota bacterium]
TVTEHADYVGGLRQAADAAGVEVVINARTDVFLKPAGTFEDPLAEAIARLSACEQAGARCAYPVLAPDAAAISALVAALRGPINVIASPTNGSVAGGKRDLQDLGVRRITFGPILQRELAAPLSGLVAGWL